MYSYLDSWLFCTAKKNLFNKAAAHPMLLYLLCFSYLMRHEQKDLWIINNLLDVLVCSIADYFYL